MDIVSYVIGLISGKKQGAGNITIDGNITCTETADGEITIEEDSDGE